MENIETAISVKHQLPPNHSPFPNGYYKGAHQRLPFNIGSIIAFASMAAVENGTKNELIKELEDIYDLKNEQIFTNFDSPKIEFDNEIDKEEYEFQYKRELKIKKDLEQHGLKFPTNIEEAIDLLVELGLIFEEEKDGEIYIDVLISPYPTADELFKKETIK